MTKTYKSIIMDRDGRPMFISNADGKIEQIIEPCEDMTREEAIKEIKDMIDSWQEDYANEVFITKEGIQALNKAIKALEQEPCEN